MASWLVITPDHTPRSFSSQVAGRVKFLPCQHCSCQYCCSSLLTQHNSENSLGLFLNVLCQHGLKLHVHVHVYTCISEDQHTYTYMYSQENCICQSLFLAMGREGEVRVLDTDCSCQLVRWQCQPHLGWWSRHDYCLCVVSSSPGKWLYLNPCSSGCHDYCCTGALPPLLYSWP